MATTSPSPSTAATTTHPATADAPSFFSVPKRVPIPPRGVDYRNKIVLAPMVRSGELPMRLLSLHYGADLVWGPETVDRALIGCTTRTNPRTGMLEFTRVPSNSQSASSCTQESVIYRIDPVREAGKLIFQLGTADPDRAVAAARIVAPHVAGIDVNAGCPKPFSTSGGMGAALLKTPDTLVGILKALVADIVPTYQIGVSVKIRILETPAETEALVRRLVGTGITGLTVHCRTTPMRPRERAIRGQLGMIVRVCREAGVACVMNGDVESREDGLRLMGEFGADGAMIATSAEKNPSCFAAMGQQQRAPWEEVARRYLGYAVEVENKFSNSKFSLSQLIPGKAPAARAVHGAKGYGQLVEVLGMEGDKELVRRAEEVDRVLGIGRFLAPPEAKKKNKQNGVLEGDQNQAGKKRKREDGGDEDGKGGRKKPVTEVSVGVAEVEGISQGVTMDKAAVAV
ncbi:tRNA-dihydrouridine synthase [Echria macrotheca]|uniref:tRNA-dihydrouridine synthase n=1 Tax=Echria macrotheca TaxID=438768 RepID=A0AAJ0B743_9PEZI|nr:tRNA-dihydrouridine synthase [Echria macrotheca]